MSVPAVHMPSDGAASPVQDDASARPQQLLTRFAKHYRVRPGSSAGRSAEPRLAPMQACRLLRPALAAPATRPHHLQRRHS